MRKLHAFRPTAPESLEHRWVLSQSVSTPSALIGPALLIPRGVPSDPQVIQAFDQFLRDYTQAVQTVLLAPGADGSINPAAHRDAFEAEVEAALDRLGQALTGAMARLSAPSEQVAQVREVILGTASDSLRSQLEALAAALIANAASSQTLLADATQAIRQAADSVNSMAQAPARPPVAQGATAPAQALDAPGGGQVAPALQAIDAVRTAFGTFLQDYFRAARDVLLAPGADGAVDPEAHRAAFDEAIAPALDRLHQTIAAALDRLGPDEGLSARLHEAILGAGPESLQSRLAALPTPTPPQGPPLLQFRTDSFQAVGFSLSLVLGDINDFLHDVILALGQP